MFVHEITFRFHACCVRRVLVQAVNVRRACMYVPGSFAGVHPRCVPSDPSSLLTGRLPRRLVRAAGAGSPPRRSPDVGGGRRDSRAAGSR
jgi:hypothetical protein